MSGEESGQHHGRYNGVCRHLPDTCGIDGSSFALIEFDEAVQAKLEGPWPSNLLHPVSDQESVSRLSARWGSIGQPMRREWNGWADPAEDQRRTAMAQHPSYPVRKTSRERRGLQHWGDGTVRGRMAIQRRNLARKGRRLHRAAESSLTGNTRRRRLQTLFSRWLFTVANRFGM